MKRISVALIGIAALLAQSASAQSLFTTYDDFLQWQSGQFTVYPVANPDSEGSDINGLGNTNANGQVGTGGALAIQYPQGGAPYSYAGGSPGEQGYTNFIAALKQTGKVLTYDFKAPSPVTPTGTTGTYFQVGVVVNCEGLFDQLFPTSTTSLGGGWSRASIDWSVEASNIVAQEVSNGGTFTYFQIVLIYNSDYNPSAPFYVDNFVMRDAPTAPAKLYTTTSDFTGWSTEAGFTNVGPTNLDLDGNVTNGVGNLTSPGSAGTGGSLQIVHFTNDFGVMSFAPYEQSNTAFVAALLNASAVTFDYTTPVVGTGVYFQAGIAVDYDGHYDQLFPTATTTVSGSVTRASIDWVSEAQALAAQYAAGTDSFGYVRIGILWNSDYGPDTTPFQIDNITAITNPPAAYIIPASSNLVSEGCSPGNGAIDPGETVTVGFALQNAGNDTVSNVVGTLLASSGVSSPSGAQSYGALAGGGSVTNSFTFTANGTCGDNLVATLQLTTNSVFYRTVPFGFTLGTLGAAATNNYSSGGVAVPIPDYTTVGTNNYPGSITNSITITDTGSVAKVVVRVRINHTYTGDLSMWVVHPDGTMVSLIAYDESKGGNNFGSGNADCTGTFTVFDDAAATPIAAGNAPYAGSYKPRQPLSVLNGKPSQGTWKLIVSDNGPGDTGTLYCWQAQIAVQPYSCCNSPVTDPFTTWQSQYFAGGGSNPNAAPGADPDADGMSNTNEFLAGFVPTNNAAYLHIINVAKTSGTNVTVTYLGANGNSTTTPPMLSRTNILESTTGTANGSYSNNFLSTGQTNILSGGTGLGTITSFVDTNGASTPSKYYRVRVLVP
ncbi:MAG TPA: proprotein convertase P-domain-containing protein [Verrucomicrobiae bacterium]|nr:proprotein convertase P-domain-containing protein [Verrucomicrobiae bacterium]